MLKFCPEHRPIALQRGYAGILKIVFFSIMTAIFAHSLTEMTKNCTQNGQKLKKKSKFQKFKNSRITFV